MSTIAAAAFEFTQEFIVGRHDHGAAVVAEGGAIGLHGAVKGIELRVLAKAAGIGAGGLCIGIGADELGLLEALGALALLVMPTAKLVKT